MSFNAKNLSYDKSLPPFLQRLRSQQGDTAGGLERPIARARKPKRDTDDDDEPTYVDEESHEVISKEEYAALVRDSNHREEELSTQEPVDRVSDTHGSDAKDTSADAGKGAPSSSKQQVAEIGGPRKRKQAKIVGEENIGEESKEKALEGEEKQREASTARKPKQKKKIKLSFDEE